MIATRGFLAALGCTKFVFGRAPPWTPLTALPQNPGWFKGDHTSNGKGRGEKGSKREEKVRKERGRERRGV